MSNVSKVKSTVFTEPVFLRFVFIYKLGDCWLSIINIGTMAAKAKSDNITWKTPEVASNPFLCIFKSNY